MESDAVLRREQQFLLNVRCLMDSQGARGTLFDENTLGQLLVEIKKAKSKQTSGGKNHRDYRRLAAYDVIEVEGTERVVKKNRGDSDSDPHLFYISIESMFGIMEKCHVELGHKRTLSKLVFI